MKKLLLTTVLIISTVCAWAQNDTQKKEIVPVASSQNMERVYTIYDKYKDVLVVVNAPLVMDQKKKTKVILFALPNGNNIEYTAGKLLKEGDDYRYDIQHIAAQTRWLRNEKDSYNYVTIYLQTRERSWGTWRRVNKDIVADVLPVLVEDMVELYAPYNPTLTLSSHSGGGYFIFEYIRVSEKLHPAIERLVFLDSTYGYEPEVHKEKLTSWLKNKKHCLNVTSYQDSTVIYNGKPLVSPHGGTWWRSKKMQSDLAETYSFDKMENDEFLNFYGNGGQMTFTLKKSPDGIIYHTVLVEKNGFIDTVLSGTADFGVGYTFWGERVYEKYIKDAPMIKMIDEPIPLRR